MRQSHAMYGHNSMHSPPASRRRLRPSGSRGQQLTRDVSISIISCSSRESLGNYSMQSCSSTESLQDGKSWVKTLGKQIFSKQKSPRGPRIRKGRGIRREPKRNSVAPGRVAPFQAAHEFGTEKVMDWWNTGQNLQDDSIASVESGYELEGGTAGRIGIAPPTYNSQFSQSYRGTTTRHRRVQWDAAPQSSHVRREAGLDEPELQNNASPQESLEEIERRKRQDAMSLICGYFEKEQPMVEKVKVVCAEKKMEMRRQVRERQAEKRRKQAELRKNKAEKKKRQEKAEEEMRQKEEEEEKQRKLDEARTYLEKAKKQQRKAQEQQRKQWEKEYAKEQEVLKNAFVRAQRKQLEKDKEKFGARPITAGGSVVAEAEVQQQHETAAEWWEGGATGRRAQSAPTATLPLTSADSDYGSDVEKNSMGSDFDSGSDVEIDRRESEGSVARNQLAQVLQTQQQTVNKLQVPVQIQQSEVEHGQQQQHDHGLLSPSRPSTPASSLSQQTPRGTLGTKDTPDNRGSRPVTPRVIGSASRRPPRGTRGAGGSRPTTPHLHPSLSNASLSGSIGVDRPTSAGRRMVQRGDGSVAAAAAAAQVSKGLAPVVPGPSRPLTPSTTTSSQVEVEAAEAAAAAAITAAAEQVQQAKDEAVAVTAAAAAKLAAAEKAQKDAQARARALEKQVQQLMNQQQSQVQMQQIWDKREQAMAAQIQDLRNKLKETVEL